MKMTEMSPSLRKRCVASIEKIILTKYKREDIDLLEGFAWISSYVEYECRYYGVEEEGDTIIMKLDTKIRVSLDISKPMPTIVGIGNITGTYYTFPIPLLVGWIATQEIYDKHSSCACKEIEAQEKSCCKFSGIK